MSRVLELALAVVCLALVALSIYLVFDAGQTSGLDWAAVTDNWGVAFLLVLLIAVVGIIGLRLAFPRLRTDGHIVGRQGVAAFAFVYLVVFAVAWWRDGRMPVQGVPILLGLLIGTVYSYSRRGGADA